jgi:NTP pyrophosphatase (non-canonical NTP hydrolase)
MNAAPQGSTPESKAEIRARHRKERVDWSPYSPCQCEVCSTPESAVEKANSSGEKEAVEVVALQGQNYRTLRSANIARQAAWCPENVPDLSFRGNELAGETGEVCNVIKKLERERLGWRGSRDTKEHLAEELADVVICADLIAIAAGINLDLATAQKFNATSEKVGLPHRLDPQPATTVQGQKELRNGYVLAMRLLQSNLTFDNEERAAIEYFTKPIPAPSVPSGNEEHKSDLG